MNRRAFLKSAAATAACAVASRHLTVAAPTPASDSAPIRPNILLIMTDQQHAGMMSCTGNRLVKTPALDALALGGIRFDRAYCTNPICVPSRMSMATGMMPGRLGVTDNRSGTSLASLPEGVADRSMGKLMKQAGYETFYGGKVHMCRDLAPLNTGYDQFERNDREDLPARCLEFVGKKRSAPFFAVASFINPHDICYFHGVRDGKDDKRAPGLAELFRKAASLADGELPPLPANFAVPEDEPTELPIKSDPDAPTPAGLMRQTYSERDWRMYRWVYARLTELVDEQIGRLLKGLRDAGLDERTLVIFTSDHGDMDASHRLASKRFFYEESVRVPLILRWPGVIPAGRVDAKHLVSTGLDLLPTLCDAAGVKAPAGLLGSSLRLLAEGREDRGRRNFVVSESAGGRMIRTLRYKYCVYAAGRNREWLVDLEQDPGELRNRASDPAAATVLREHRALLKAWIEESADTLGAPYIVQ